MTDKIKINYERQVSCGATGLVMTYYTTDIVSLMNSKDRDETYISLVSENKGFSHDDMKKLIKDAEKNDYIMSKNSSYQNITKPYYVYDVLREKDFPVFDSLSLVNLYSSMYTVYTEDYNAFDKKIIEHVDKVFHLLIGASYPSAWYVS